MSLPFKLPPIKVPEQGAQEYMEERKGTHKNNKFIAKGSYGVVYRTNNGVVKLYAPGTNVDKEIAKANKMIQRTGNERQKMKKRRVTHKNIPYNALEQYRTFNSLNSFMKNQLPAVQMPHLGIDLISYCRTQPFVLTVDVFLAQCHKLLAQTKALYQNGESHGDVRMENIMIDDNHLTLVDFDLFGTWAEVAKEYETGIHANHIPSWAPPEFLLLGKNEQLERYAEGVFTRYSHYFQSINIMNPSELSLRIQQSIVENISYINRTRFTLLDDIKYLDNVGLAMSLLELLTILYPTPEPKIIQTRELLEKVAHFEISKRILPDQAEAEMRKILTQGGSRRTRRNTTKRIY